MSTALSELAAGQDALARRDWERARAAFQAAAETEGSPEAFDGLGRALWWLKRPREGIEARTRAYAAYKESGRYEQAARIAVWLAREHQVLFANAPAAEGWLARATSLAERASGSVSGWLQLALSATHSDPETLAFLLQSALAAARNDNDGDLEILALARLGVTEIARGRIEAGLTHLDEAMAAASAQEGRDPQTLAEAYCALMEASDLLGDRERLVAWTQNLDPGTDLGPLALHASGSVPTALSAFCGACCGGIYMVTGRIDAAESELMESISFLESAGMRSRCVHPVTQLADLRVVQGRLEEARSLLAEYEDLPEAVRPLALIDLALGDPASALLRLRSRIAQLADFPVLAFPLLLLVVEGELARGDWEAAENAVKAVETTANMTGSLRHEGFRLLYEGRVLAARGSEEAPPRLRESAKKLAASGLVLMSCRARLDLAQALASSDQPVAIAEARAALAAFERLGATADADKAASFLRALGVKGRTGPRELGSLTKREIEVLRLIAKGLSNSEIAERLFISNKTAGHHVSSILLKLGLRSRTEAAAFAAVHLGPEGAQK